MYYFFRLENNNCMKRCKDFVSEEEKWITSTEILQKGGYNDRKK